MDGDDASGGAPGPKEELVQQLQHLIQAIEASGHAILPRSDEALLESVVEGAARIFGAEAASIALVDEEAQELVFRVSYSQTGGHSVIGMRFPITQGIAGYVAMTGQPMAVSDVRQDDRFNQDFAESTGYVPKSILATPLLSGETVIGVMEVLDKLDGNPFSMQDMDLLAIFARQAAIAINQAQLHSEIGEALAQGLIRLAADVEGEFEGKSAELIELIEASRSGTPSDLLELANLFNDIAALGSAERRACIQILEVFSEYRRRKSPRLGWL